MKLKLENVIDMLDMINNEIDYYYNPQTKQFFPSNIGDFENLNEDQLDDLFESSIILPSNYEINEYQIMADFINTIDDHILYNQLFRSIKGKRAFRRFKDTCINNGIIDKWYKFRYEKYKNIAITWCNKNNIDFE